MDKNREKLNYVLKSVTKYNINTENNVSRRTTNEIIGLSPGMSIISFST